DVKHPFSSFPQCGEDVRLDDVVDEAKIPARFPVTINFTCSAACKRLNPSWYDRCVGAIGILPGTEHIEVSQSSRPHTVHSRDNAGIKLIHPFGRGVG